MNAFYLHKPDGTKTDISACGTCGSVARGESNFDISERCCTCYDCGLPLSKEERRYATALYHRACEDERTSKHAAELLEKATEVVEPRPKRKVGGRRNAPCLVGLEGWLGAYPTVAQRMPPH